MNKVHSTNEASALTKQTQLVYAIIVLLLVFGGVGSWWFNRPDPVRVSAEQAYRDGRWQAALRDYTTLYQRNPDGDVGIQLLHIYAIRGDWQTLDAHGLDLLNQSLTQEQRDETVMLLGWSAVQRGDLSAAQNWWHSTTAARQWQIHILHADVALRQGDIISATYHLNESATIQGAWRTAWLLRAAEIAVTDAPSTTLELLDQIQVPAIASALPPLDPAFIQQRMTALRDIARQDADARKISLARLWRDEGLADAAAIMLQQVPADSSLDSLAHDEWARIRWSQGDAEGALADLNATIERYPNVAALRRTQATIAASMGNIAQATDALEQAVIMDGKIPENYFVVAAIWLAQNDFDQAAAAYDAAIQTGILTGTSYLQAANFYINTPLRPCESGLKYARGALNTEVDNVARRVIAQVALQCGNPREAFTVLAPLSEKINDDPQLLYLRGLTFWRFGWRSFALRDFERAADLAPNSAWRRDAERYLDDEDGRMKK